MSAGPPRSRIYTRTGDSGRTGLVGGARVGKEEPRVEAYGTVDELSSALGVASAFLDDAELAETVAGIQNELFNVGAELASAGGPGGAPGRQFLDPAAKIAALEALIDRYDAALPPLRTFILPSGARAGALLHLARAVCRRAERLVVRLGRAEPVAPELLVYLNRLSDLLFVLARHVNHAAGRPEVPWRKG